LINSWLSLSLAICERMHADQESIVCNKDQSTRYAQDVLHFS
jgi:hypothetical protein